MESLPSLTELISAIGVIASILYLAIQVRQNTLSTRASTIHSLTTRMNERLLLVASNDELAELLTLDWEDDELSPTQKTKLRYWLSAIITDLRDIYFQHQMGIVPKSTLNARVAIIRRRIFRTEIGLDLWLGLKDAYEDDFVQWFNQEVGVNMP